MAQFRQWQKSSSMIRRRLPWTMLQKQTTKALLGVFLFLITTPPNSLPGVDFVGCVQCTLYGIVYGSLWYSTMIHRY